MSGVNYKEMSTKLVVLSIFSLLIILSGCISTEEKSSTNATAPTNQQSELTTEERIEVAPKDVTSIKASPKLEAKVSQPEELALKPIVNKPSKKIEANIDKNIEPSEAVIKVKVEPSITVAKALPLPVISLDSLSQLPLSLNNGWVVTIKKPPLATKEICVLYHEKNGVFDGYKDNNIKLYLTLSQLLIKSGSNFDLSYPDTGVYVEDIDNNSSFYSLTLSSQKTIAALVLPLSDYIKNSSKKLVIKSGFWPSWPVTDTKTIMFQFTEVDSMIKTLNTCTSLLTAP